MSKTNSDLNLARLLYQSIEHGDYVSCEEYLRLGANVNLLLPEGITPFHIAAGSNASNAADIVKLCIKHAANPNARSSEGLTPVHVSATWGKADVLKILLQNGGNPSLTDENNETALDLAVENDQPAAVEVLINHEKRNNIRLSLSSLTLGEDEYIVKKLSNNASFVIPKTSTFSKPTCCQQSQQDKSSCTSPSDTSFRLRRSNSDSAFGQSFSSTSWHLDRFFCKPDSSASKSCTKIDETKTTGTRSVIRKRLEFDLENNSTCDGSGDFVTCNETDFLPSMQSTDVTSATTPYSNGLQLCMEGSVDEESTGSPFSPAEIMSCDPTTRGMVNSFLMESPSNTDMCKVGRTMVVARKPFILRHDDNGPFSTSSPRLSLDLELKLDDAMLRDENKDGFENGMRWEEEVNLKRFVKNEFSDCNSKENTVEEYIYTDEDEGIALIEQRYPRFSTSVLGNSTGSSETTIIYNWHQFVGNGAISSAEHIPANIKKLTDTQLLHELKVLGDDPGPITKSTRIIYQLRLMRLKQCQLEKNLPMAEDNVMYSKELSSVIDGKLNLDMVKQLEMKMCEMFEHTSNPHQRWREGRSKNCFNYLLLDPRVTQNLPARATVMSKEEQLKTFLSSVFYIGKGKRTRPYSHLYEAAMYLQRGERKTKPTEKVAHILNIWASGQGVVSLHCFQNVIPVEAYTREACMVDSIGLKNISNKRHGDVYGAVARWTGQNRRRLGAYLLYRACHILLNEGERQIRPADM